MRPATSTATVRFGTGAGPETTTTNPPWGTTADGEFTRSGVALAGVMGTLSLLVLPLAVLGIVLSSVQLKRVKEGNPTAGKYMLASWIAFTPGTVLAVVALLALLVSRAT